MGAPLHQRCLRVVLRQARPGLLEDVDRSALVRHGLLEDHVLLLPALAGLLQADLHGRHLGLQLLDLRLQRGDRVLQAKLLALEVLLLLLLGLDGVLGAVDLRVAEAPLLRLRLLLRLQLGQHLVHDLLHLREWIEPDTHRQRGQHPVRVLPCSPEDMLHRQRDGLVASRVGALLGRGALVRAHRSMARAANLQEAHRLRIQVSRVVRGQHRDGLAERLQLLGARRRPLRVLLLIILAALLQREEELLVGREGVLCCLDVLLSLRSLGHGVRQRPLLLLLRGRGRRDLGELGAAQLLEEDHRLQILLLRRLEAPLEIVLHLREHAVDAAAAHVVGARPGRIAFQVSRL
mmetsp:Transcript_88688/g.228738  ORF Transcript_88688/g.228738 Transcript_88688/m.228738 type:complete len:348 (+) Transcript_88688:571-1614(+)